MTELISGKKANTSPSLLLVSQFIFNTGFYAVVPFLAIFLRDDMLLSGAAIGLVLGLRTFSQQGMFLVGGALTGLADVPSFCAAAWSESVATCCSPSAPRYGALFWEPA